MKLNINKTKTMIFNFTDKYQFTTRLTSDNIPIEVIAKIKLLGIVITSDISWDSNTEYLVKRAYKRMQIIHKLVE